MCPWVRQLIVLVFVVMILKVLSILLVRLLCMQIPLGWLLLNFLQITLTTRCLLKWGLGKRLVHASTILSTNKAVRLLHLLWISKGLLLALIRKWVRFHRLKSMLRLELWRRKLLVPYRGLILWEAQIDLLRINLKLLLELRVIHQRILK
jgi:hypothetical protein